MHYYKSMCNNPLCSAFPTLASYFSFPTVIFQKFCEMANICYIYNIISYSCTTIFMYQTNQISALYGALIRISISSPSAPNVIHPSTSHEITTSSKQIDSIVQYVEKNECHVEMYFYMAFILSATTIIFSSVNSTTGIIYRSNIDI